MSMQDTPECLLSPSGLAIARAAVPKLGRNARRGVWYWPAWVKHIAGRGYFTPMARKSYMMYFQDFPELQQELLVRVGLGPVIEIYAWLVGFNIVTVNLWDVTMLRRNLPRPSSVALGICDRWGIQL